MTDAPAGGARAGQGGAGHTEEPEPPRRRPALSPSRAGDFKQCPLLYRFRAIDRLPELPGRAQVRGTLVHTVLERLFELPAADRSPDAARELVGRAWAELRETWPELVGQLFAGRDDPQLADWLASIGPLLEAYFRLEDPRLVQPQARELLVETELESGVLLRGYIDRLDVAPGGQIRVVDYKTGPAPREAGETAALFQMKFYALVLLHLRGVVPAELRLLYLTGGESLSYVPEEQELRRFERTLEAIWAAVLRAGREGDFPPSPGRRCDWCSHRALCPAWEGTPPEYPGWPVDDPLAEAPAGQP